MNITLQFVIDADESQITNPQIKAMRNVVGDIVGAMLTSDIAEPPSKNSRLGFAHITGVPVSSAKKIRKLFDEDIKKIVDLIVVVPVYEYEEMQTSIGFNQFISEPVSSIAPDIDHQRKCLPSDLDATRALFSTITSEEQDPYTLVYTINGTVSAVELTGTQYELARKRKWKIAVHAIPAAVRQEIIDNREITITWTTAKNFIRRKNVVDYNDSTTDDDSAQITDLDVS